MNKVLLIIFLCFSFIGLSQTVKDVSIQLEATVQNNNSIKITWQATSSTANYVLARREYGANSNWVTLKNDIGAAVTEYVDLTVVEGKSYEYSISNKGYGYVASGIKVPVIHNSGDLLLLVDSAVYENLKVAIKDTLIQDLIGDGWNVETAVIGTVENPVSVKARIKEWYTAGKENPHVYLFGHIPVAYSGNFNGTGVNVPPDVHVPEHVGAWATDCYYVDMDGTWTDNLTNRGATNGWGTNLPGDGKFDQHTIPGRSAEVAVGRVDLSNLPGISSDENYLLANYIKKAHLWKHGKTIVPKKALIADRLQWLGGEAPGRTGWMNLPGLVGSDSIVENTNYFPHLKANKYLFSQVTSTASYNSISGIGSMTNLKNNVNSVFNSYFGSYFGDWDTMNNFLRAAISSETHTLTSVWNGRPTWFYHALGMGESFGNIAKANQSNSGDYFNYYTFFRNGIQINLMGDPTLKIHRIQPVTGLSGIKASGDREVNLTWTASTEPNVLGYYVYRSIGDEKNSDYELVSNTMLTSTSFTDKQPYYGTTHYMVRSVKLEDRASGSYYNLGQGIFTEVVGVESGNFYSSVKESFQNQWKIYPNPAKDMLYGTSQLNGKVSVAIHNTLGVLVYKESELSNNFNISLENFNTGLYFITVSNELEQFTEKVIVE